MTRRISAAEAKAHFSDLLSSVAYAGERFLVERHGKPAAAVVSIEDLGRLKSSSRERPSQGLVALTGILEGHMAHEEVDAMIDDLYAARDQEVPRPFNLPDDVRL